MSEENEKDTPKRITIGREGDYTTVGRALWHNPDETNIQFVLIDKVHRESMVFDNEKLECVTLTSDCFTRIVADESGELIVNRNIHRFFVANLFLSNVKLSGTITCAQRLIFDGANSGVVTNETIILTDCVFVGCVPAVMIMPESGSVIDLFDILNCLFICSDVFGMPDSYVSKRENDKLGGTISVNFLDSIFYHSTFDCKNVFLDGTKRNIDDSSFMSEKWPPNSILEHTIPFRSPPNYDFRFQDESIKGVGPNRELLEQIYQVHLERQMQSSERSLTLPGIYINVSLAKLEADLKNALENSDDLEWAFLNDTSQNNYDALFIIMALDEEEPGEKPFELIQTCQDSRKPFHILLSGRKFPVTQETMNMERLVSVQKNRKRLENSYPDQIVYFEALEEIGPLIYDRIQNITTTLILKKLTLQNIGAFKDLSLDLNNRLNCLVGLNGTGKTTVLRAMTLALTGPHESLDLDLVGESLLRIEGLGEEGIQRAQGMITLEFEMNGQTCVNRVDLELQANNEIKISMDGTSPALNGDYLKALVLGFAQIRDNASDRISARNAVQPPYIPDIQAMIQNQPDGRLREFESWISSLDATANQKEKEQNGGSKTAPSERQLLEDCFHIFSKITGQQVRFHGVSQPNHRVWIETDDAPQGIPMGHTSQGFQAVMGWVGFFLQRIFEAYGRHQDPKGQPAVVLVDEIDTYLHPQWQSRILGVLAETFPKTQFIISTHSPLVVHGLNRGQVTVLEKEGDTIKAHANAYDLWAWGYQDILNNLYQTPEKETPHQEHQLEARLKVLNGQEELSPEEEAEKASLEDNLTRLRESLKYRDEITALQVQYKQKLEKLDAMIQKVKGKQ